MPTATCSASTPSLTVPATQNTAPVHEFNCLYTHDIRRKSKRWQDGFLRFHTFNKRIVVFDVPRNTIGDTHWTADEPLQEGDEVTLDRSGVLVQVADQVGSTETDLTELRKSKNKPVDTRGSSSPLHVPSGGVGRAIERGEAWIKSGRPVLAATTRQPLQEKHRSLNALLGSNRAPIGKVPAITHSPFEVRQQQEKSSAYDEERPVKRQKVVKSDTAKTSKQRSNRIDTTTRDVVGGRTKQDTASDRPSLPVIELSSDGEDQRTSMTSHKPAASSASQRNEDEIDRATQRIQSHKHSAPATKLSLKAPNTKRGMLVCMPANRTTTPSDIDSQQKRLDARLARLAQRTASIAMVGKSGAGHVRPPSTVRQNDRLASGPPDSTIAAMRDVCSQPSEYPEDDDLSELGGRTQPGRRRGETYDLFGTCSVGSKSNRNANQKAFTSAHSQDQPQQPGVMNGGSLDTSSPMNTFPSTLEMDQALAKDAEQVMVIASDDSAGQELGSQMLSQEDEQTATEYNAAQSHDKPTAARSSSAGAKQPVQDAWSREAFDLFKWRPPDWDEEKWCVSAP